ncbi:MAG: tetratricopeptide (TPR) repeat protein [Saprospiraceae bacterium]|jgi:tetratricopeptide (TPR) repeat protein
MRLRFLFIMTLAICLTNSALGQSEFKKADKLLSLKAFDLAIKNYKDALTKYPGHAEGYAQLGQAYLMTNQLIESIKAFERAFAFQGQIDDKYKLLYGTALKKVGLYDKAESVFFEYASVDSEMANHLLASTEYAKSILQEPDQYDILSFEGNSDKSDFGTSFYKDQVVFCSFRDDFKRENSKKNVSYIQRVGNQIFQKDRDGSNNNVSFLRSDYKEIYNIGPLSYSKDGRMVALMRNTFTTGSNQIYSDEGNMSIYLGLTDEKGDFTDEKPFPFNQIEYSYSFPSLGYNGNALYFSSNRPGGLGGFDIYVSYFKDGRWTNPENMGEAINTSGNEITPYFDGEKLYFASEYRLGLGGYDNFVSEVMDGQWAAATNMGKGINSPADDYYLTPNFEDGNYFFTSNRLGGRGKDDIYVAYKLSEQEEPMVYEELEIPSAVRLDDIASVSTPSNTMEVELTIDDINGAQEIIESSSSEAVAVAVSEAETITTYNAPAETIAIEEEAVLMDFSGAKLVAVTLAEKEFEDIYASVYFIQLASLAQSEGDINNYKDLKSYGKLYRFFKSSSVKIRLGHFNSRVEAESVLSSIKGNGYGDAFITSDVLATADYEVIGGSESSSSQSEWINDYTPSSNFKVKLASYLDPLQFKVDNVLDIGQLEQWTKGKWTIFILGGFETFEAAKAAKIKALNRGFTDAEMVEDDNGVLKRISEH